MGVVISYDDKFASPSSEIKLDSGEHVVMRLDKQGLVIKSIGAGGVADQLLFQAKAKVVAEICAGLFDDRGESKATPLQILTAAVTQLPNATAVKEAFEAAADVV
jgi:hypothetical protein